MDQGHALLVGVGGSGRQSLARLAAFAAGCEVFEITLSRGYGEEEFREDLKQLYHKLGLENKKVGEERRKGGGGGEEKREAGGEGEGGEERERGREVGREREKE